MITNPKSGTGTQNNQDMITKLAFVQKVFGEAGQIGFVTDWFGGWHNYSPLLIKLTHEGKCDVFASWLHCIRDALSERKRRKIIF